MAPETRKYTRNKAPPPTPAPAMADSEAENVDPEDGGDENTDDEVTDDEVPDDRMTSSGVTYFIDEHGRYYYQPNPTRNSIVAVDPGAPQPPEREPVPEPETDQESEPESEPDQESEAEPEHDSEPEPEPEPTEDMIVPDMGGSLTQTVTLVPTENSNGEVSYVLVVSDETKDLVNLNIKMDTEDVEQEEKQDEAGDVYTFEDDEEGEGSAVASDDELAPPGSQRIRHKSGTIFTCNFCSYNSHRRYLLLRHMKSHSEDRPFKCIICERGFKTQASLLNHVNMHNGVKPHICKFCQSTFTTSGELVRHVRYKHTHEKPHKCTECDYASVELSKLRRHVRCHTGERPYQCPHCTYASPDTFKLKRHLRTHTGEKPYKCDMCAMCFTQSNSLKAHKLIHNVSEKPVFPCELCPAKCGRKTDLRIHVQKLHTAGPPLKCRRCGKSFPDRYSCKLHNKTHEGEKCFKCDLCPYASTTMRHLKSHILKHTDQKPFACDECDQTFRQKQLLRRHQNLYHNPNYVPRPPKEKTHTCHSCHRTFAHKGNLMRHLAVHDPESGHHERALALKIGRQKKVKYIDSNALQHPFLSEIKTESVNTDMVKVGVSNSLKRGELVTVSDGDGQQYVVLEVIQLEDGTEQQVAVVAPDFLEGHEMEEGEETDDYGEEETLGEEEDEEEKKRIQKQLREQEAAERSIKLERDVDNCFGFDCSDEEEENEIEPLVEVNDEEVSISVDIPSVREHTPKDTGAVPSDLPTLLFDGDEEEDGIEDKLIYELV